MIRAALIFAGAMMLCPISPRFGAAEQDNLQALLGPEKRVRDSVSFTTEKGERAALVLYVTNVQAFGGDRVEIEAPLGCADQVAGIPLAGVYHVALIVDGVVINEITLSPPGGGADGVMALPLRNLPRYNYEHWGQGTPEEYDPEAKQTEPTKLLRLADFNGDGRAWEFRLVQSGVCGHFSTLVAGYSAARRAAIVHPILSGPFRSDWADNFFAHPTVGNGTRIESSFACGDHGNETEVWQEYLYDPKREAWVLNRHRERVCEGADTIADKPLEPLPSPIALTVASAEGSPGEEVSVEVSIDTHDVAVDRVAHAIIVDPRISVAAIAGLDLQRATGDWSAADDGVAPIHCRSELVDSCEWAFHMRLHGDFRGRSVLYALRFAIPRGAAPGAYTLRNVDFAAAGSGKRLPITGADGELLVRAPGEE
jgi:hypothetical protein